MSTRQPTGKDVNEVAKAIHASIQHDDPEEREWADLSSGMRNAFRDMARAGIARYEQTRLVGLGGDSDEA